MTKPFPVEDIGDMVFYMRRDDTNYQHNNFNVGFNTVSGEDPGVKQICVVGMGDEGIVMQNDSGGTAFLSDLNAGEWYKIHFKWDAGICQAIVSDGAFASLPKSTPAGFGHIYIFARGQAIAYLDDIQDLAASHVGPPTTIDQCKKGEWQLFDTPRHFKNQGDCIQFVNTGK